MGIDEAVARSNASRLLEQALDDGALVPGARGYAAARIKRLERWLTPPRIPRTTAVPRWTPSTASAAAPGPRPRPPLDADCAAP